MIFYKANENRTYWKDLKALRRKPAAIVTEGRQERWKYAYLNHRPSFDPQYLHCKGMCFGGSQEP